VHDLAYPIGAGFSNETIFFRAVLGDGDPRTEDLVLRVSPAPEHQMFLHPEFDAQVRLLRTLHDRDLARVPRVRWSEEDPSWFGRPFFVMDRLHGRVPVSMPVYNSAGWLYDAEQAQRRIMWESALRELARIHQVPPDLLQHSVDYGRAHYQWATEGVAHPSVDRLLEWIEDNVPASPTEGLSWGDARIGNMMFGDDFRLVAVMDWEQATLSGSLLDLGWWLFFDDVHSLDAPRLDGLGGRQETIDLWEEWTGLSANDVLWYEVFAGVRVATLTLRTMNMLGGTPTDTSRDVNPFTRVAYDRLGWAQPQA
jgi:aminoglycoside phosphotransferase (APT) family kinase protein